MAYEKLQGDQLYDGKRFYGREKVLIRHTGTGATEIVDAGAAGDDIQYRPGLVRPGFTNAHCHLELSHMQGVIPKHTGLVSFLKEVVNKRDFAAERMHVAMENSLREMEADGISAVGDISNTDITVMHKRNTTMQFHNFIEVLSFSEANTAARIAHYEGILETFRKQGLEMSALTPHAPYSVSASAFRAINAATVNGRISVHNQETAAENELFMHGKGEFLQLFEKFGISESPFPVTGTSSLQSYLPFFDGGQTIILVHNTFTSREDVDWALDLAQRRGLNLFFCLCPNANLYIEDRTPDIPMLREAGCRIILGTDSYSSNDQLKISAELETIHRLYPEIPREETLHWATLAGAEALGAEPVWLNGLPLI